MCTTLRVSYRVSSERTARPIIIKISSSTIESRKTGAKLGLYRQEVDFYQNLGPYYKGSSVVPDCYFSALDDEGFVTLVLEDVGKTETSPQLEGCGFDEAALALRALANFQAPVLGDWMLGGMTPWLRKPNLFENPELYSSSLPVYLGLHKPRKDLSSEHENFLKFIDGYMDKWVADVHPPLCAVHGDFRLDNMIIHDGVATVVDWQTVAWGSAMRDAAYFIGSSLTLENRRKYESELFDLYLTELNSKAKFYVPKHEAWEEYRRQTIYGLSIVVTTATSVGQTEDGMTLAAAMIARHAQHAIDLDVASLLKGMQFKAGTNIPKALVPYDVDEYSHELPGVSDYLWNESWYFDCVTPSGDLGAYMRLGRLPNQSIALYTAAITRVGKPAIMLVDPRAPLPDKDDVKQKIITDKFVAEQDCEKEHESFRVKIFGTGAAHEDNAAPLHGDPGIPIENVGFDLTWKTDGVPFAWRMTPRYEIPCTITGTIKIGDEEIEFSGPGQRDHSWGNRDWWKLQWMWTAVHFDDGEHIHAFCMMGNKVPFNYGYIQRPGEDVIELTSVKSYETIEKNGAVKYATVKCEPEGLVLQIEVTAIGALLLINPKDGRESKFPRSMCKATRNDGKVGYGWIEWNYHTTDY
ncbi:DUF1679 domain-containing protein [Kockiozyma suomiensis]|uniref:DUF1679 domain-containing protein n=1 Tax=Kockiozyma suomiensis TaxID=1337062 RepID=UPI0033441CD5